MSNWFEEDKRSSLLKKRLIFFLQHVNYLLPISLSIPAALAGFKPSAFHTQGECSTTKLPPPGNIKKNHKLELIFLQPSNHQFFVIFPAKSFGQIYFLNFLTAKTLNK
jgi:hypothetical protein